MDNMAQSSSPCSVHEYMACSDYLKDLYDHFCIDFHKNELLTSACSIIQRMNA